MYIASSCPLAFFILYVCVCVRLSSSNMVLTDKLPHCPVCCSDCVPVLLCCCDHLPVDVAVCCVAAIIFVVVLLVAFLFIICCNIFCARNRIVLCFSVFVCFVLGGFWVVGCGLCVLLCVGFWLIFCGNGCVRSCFVSYHLIAVSQSKY